jgi:hypothetical protein
MPVDTVTAYLDPMLDPSCGMGGDPPPVGGKPQDLGIVTGELVWQGGVEFQRAPWTNVPAPIGPNETQVAYLFTAASEPTAAFQLPDPSLAVHPNATGGVGYAFTLVTQAGNRALYALAGIQNNATSKFTAYAMGLVGGVPVAPGATTKSIYVNMTSTLDQVVTMDVAAPAAGPKGPDRVRATVSIMLGNAGFAILPTEQKTPLLPLTAPIPFVGVPSVSGGLAGSSYWSTARAVTGPSFAAPMSVVGHALTTATNVPVKMDGFLAVPTLVTPALNAAWDGQHLATSFPAMGGPIDFTEYQVVSGNGLVSWTVVVPSATNAVSLPNLSSFEKASVPAGPVTIGIYGAHIDSFDYKKLRYRDLRPQNMRAYSLDYFNAHL